MSQVHCEAVNSCQCHETWNFHCHGDTQMLDHLQKCLLTVQGSPWPHSHPCSPDNRRFYLCSITTYLNYCPASAVMIRHRRPHRYHQATLLKQLCTLLLFFLFLGPPFCHPCDSPFSPQCPPCPNKQHALITFCLFSPSFVKYILKFSYFYFT